MLKRLRERAGSESGFTLIELLVVMLILGILAAIAIPAFLNQKNKANDSQSKTTVRTMQTAMETCSTDNGGTYSTTACTLPGLQKIEATIPTTGSTATPNNPVGGYTLSSKNSSTNNTYTITRQANGTVNHTCTIPSASADHGGCTITGSGTSGTW